MRAQLQNEISYILDSHIRFNKSDFRIQEEDSVFSIYYDYDDAFFFVIKFPLKSTTKKTYEESSSSFSITSRRREVEHEVYDIEVRVSPGELLAREICNVESKSDLLSKLRQWLNNLWEELISSPVNRQTEESARLVNEMKEKVKSMPDEFFSKQEAEDLRATLNDLEKRLHEQMQAQVLDKEQLKQHTQSLHNEIEALKATLFSLKKDKWYKSAVSKIYTWVSKEDNRKLLKDGTDIIKPFLLN